MRAEKENKGKGKKRKEKEKGGKNGDQNRFFLCVLFYKSTRRFFHMRSAHFSNI